MNCLPFLGHKKWEAVHECQALYNQLWFSPQYVRFNLAVIPTFNLLRLVFSLLDLLAKFFINENVEVPQGNKDNNQNYNGQSNRWDS